jgi:hypothetical protein
VLNTGRDWVANHKDRAARAGTEHTHTHTYTYIHSTTYKLSSYSYLCLDSISADWPILPAHSLLSRSMRALGYPGLDVLHPGGDGGDRTTHLCLALFTWSQAAAAAAAATLLRAAAVAHHHHHHHHHHQCARARAHISAMSAAVQSCACMPTSSMLWSSSSCPSSSSSSSCPPLTWSACSWAWPAARKWHQLSAPLPGADPRPSRGGSTEASPAQGRESRACLGPTLPADSARRAIRPRCICEIHR